MTSETICDLLKIWATKRPTQPAIVSPAGELSFYDLDLHIDECAKGLSVVGFKPGMRAVLMVRPSIEFAVLAFAMLRFGVIPVLVDPGMGKRNLGECLTQAQPEGFIGVPLAHIGRLLFGWAEKTARLFVTVGGLRLWGGESYQSILKKGAEAPGVEAQAKLSDDPAAIVFTSGSTGVPKGVIYSHRILRRQVELLQQEYSISPGEVDLATFPLFALFDPAMGVTAVFPDMNFTRPGQVDPEKIIEPIHKYEVTHMFGSPALIDRVGRFASAKGVQLKSLKRALSAGAPVSSRILRCFQSCLPEGASLYTPYGATEALPLCSISASERLELEEHNQGRGVCVGRPLPGIAIRTIQISDSPIPVWSDDLRLSNGEVGELVVAGDNVSREYFAHPLANELAKIRENDTLLHRTGDLGYIDESGRVWFCGRKAHRVETATQTLFSVCCEVVFNAHPAVFRSALVGVGQPPRKPVLCIELEKHATPSDSLKEEILELGQNYPETEQIETVLFHPAFPVDIRHNAKIFREKLATWAAEELA